MTDYMEDTPVMSRYYCPGCEPDADPITEILDVRYCATHAPNWAGVDDSTIIAETYMSGSAEAGGDEGRIWCDLIHRKHDPRSQSTDR